MSPAPLAAAFFSSTAYEDALVARRVHEISIFRDIADYATRAHALALPMVREEYPKRTGTALERGEDYLAAIYAGSVYEFLGVFAEARVKGIEYESALRQALDASAAARMPSLFIREGALADSVRHCNEHLEDRRNESDKGSVTSDALIEGLYAVEFLKMHLDQHSAIRNGSLLGIQKIQMDINDAMNAGMGLEQAARTSNQAPEFLYITMVQTWLQQQALQSLIVERTLFEKVEKGLPLDPEIRTMLETGALYRDVCVCLHAELADSVENGIYLMYFDAAADKAAKNEPIDPAVALHCCMQRFLQTNIEVLQSGEGQYCGPEDAPVFATAYAALMRAVHKQFPLRTALAPQGLPSGPVPL